MTEIFQSGGIAMWPLLLILLAVVFLAGHAAVLLARDGGGSEEVEGRLRAILFWGAMSVVMGLLGTTIGLVQMTQAISLAGRAEATTVMGGIGVSLVTSMFGLLIFLIAAVLWFSLRQWHLRRGTPSSLPA